MGIRYTYAESESFRTEPIIVAKNITANGTYDPATDNADGYAPVVVNVEGGGGSSDFSTAVLSIVDEGGYRVNLDVATIHPRGGLTMGGYYEWTDTDNFPVVLYKGSAMLELENLDNANISVSGAIENSGGNTYIITGDCTITIS